VQEIREEIEKVKLSLAFATGKFISKPKLRAC